MHLRCFKLLNSTPVRKEERPQSRPGQGGPPRGMNIFSNKSANRDLAKMKNNVDKAWYFQGSSVCYVTIC